VLTHCPASRAQHEPTHPHTSVGVDANRPFSATRHCNRLTCLRTLSAVQYGRIHLSYQMPYPLTALAQVRRVMEARRSGVLISLFQASQQAPTMAS